MTLTKLYDQKVRQKLYDNIMADVSSNSAHMNLPDTGKYISVDMLEDILTVHILRAGKEVAIDKV